MKVACLPSEASVQSGHPFSLIRSLTLCLWVANSFLHLLIYFSSLDNSLGQLSKENQRKIAIIFLSISLNICFGSSKAFEYPQHMFWLKTKKIIFSYALLSGGLIIAKQF